MNSAQANRSLRDFESLILFIAPFPPPTHGASVISERLLEYLKELHPDRKMRVIDSSGSNHGTYKVRVLYHARRIAAHFRMINLMLRFCRRNTTLYLSAGGGLGVLYTLGLSVVSRISGTKVIVHHHSYRYLKGYSYAMAITSRILSPSDIQVFLSDDMREKFQLRYRPVTRNVVVSNASVIRPQLSKLPPSEVFELVHVSNLSREKGSLLVLDVYEQLVRDGMAVSLTMVGPATSEVHDRIADVSKCAGVALDYRGALSNNEVGEVLHGKHLFLFPSTYSNEAEPLVVLEALSRGVPVLASNAGCLEEVLGKEWTIDNPTVSSLASVVRDVSRRDWPALSLEAAERFSNRRRNSLESLQDVFDLS